MFLVVLITVLLNATSLELATEQDANYNQELKALGIANVLSGLAGGLVSVNSFNRSMLNYHAGASSAWAARLCACLVIAIPVFPGLYLPHTQAGVDRIGHIPGSILTSKMGLGLSPPHASIGLFNHYFHSYRSRRLRNHPGRDFRNWRCGFCICRDI